MAVYKPKISYGATVNGKPFNPACNQSAGTVAFSEGITSTADAAKKGMEAHAAMRANEAAAKAARGSRPADSPEQRLLRPDEID